MPGLAWRWIKRICRLGLSLSVSANCLTRHCRPAGRQLPASALPAVYRPSDRVHPANRPGPDAWLPDDGLPLQHAHTRSRHYRCAEDTGHSHVRRSAQPDTGPRDPRSVPPAIHSERHAPCPAASCRDGTACCHTLKAPPCARLRHSAGKDAWSGAGYAANAATSEFGITARPDDIRAG